MTEYSIVLSIIIFLCLVDIYLLYKTIDKIGFRNNIFTRYHLNRVIFGNGVFKSIWRSIIHEIKFRREIKKGDRKCE